MFFLFKYCCMNKNGGLLEARNQWIWIFLLLVSTRWQNPPPPPPPHTPSAEMLAHTHLHTADSLMHHNWSYLWSYRCTTYWPTACNSKKTQSSPDINQRSLTLRHCPSIEVQRSVQLINMAIYKQNYISNRAIYEFNYKLLSSVV